MSLLPSCDLKTTLHKIPLEGYQTSGRLSIVIKPPERQFNTLAFRLSLDEV